MQKELKLPEKLRLNQPRINDIQVAFPGCLVVEFIGIAQNGVPKTIAINDTTYELIVASVMKMAVNGEFIKTPVKYAVYQDLLQVERITKTDATSIITAMNRQRGTWSSIQPLLSNMATKYYGSTVKEEEER